MKSSVLIEALTKLRRNAAALDGPEADPEVYVYIQGRLTPAAFASASRIHDGEVVLNDGDVPISVIIA